MGFQAVTLTSQLDEHFSGSTSQPTEEQQVTPPPDPVEENAQPGDDQQLVADPQDLDDLEFLLDEIEDQIAPLA